MQLNAPLNFNAPLPTPLRILVVEDSAINRRLAEHIFKRLGCEVVMARTGHEAIEAFANGLFHLVVMDYRLPGMDGFACTRQIRALESERDGSYQTPIMALTAYAPPDFRERCLRAGMNDCFVKPLRRDVVAEMLEWVPDSLPHPSVFATEASKAARRPGPDVRHLA